jgi:hypothetical protein
MTVNEYLNSFIQLSRYAPDDINTDEKKQDVFLSGLNDDIQFQLLNTYYANFQHMVDKAIVIENKIREMEKDGKRKVHSLDNPLGVMLGLASRSLTSFSSHYSEPASDASTSAPLSVFDAAAELSSRTSELPDAEASTATASTQQAATISPEHVARPPLQCPNYARCTTSRQPYWWSLFQVWSD